MIVVDRSIVDVSQLAISDGDIVGSSKESLSMTRHSSVNEGGNLVESLDVGSLCFFIDTLASEPTFNDWASSLTEAILDVLHGGVDRPANSWVH
jgi:hypothetical protein